MHTQWQMVWLRLNAAKTWENLDIRKGTRYCKKHTHTQLQVQKTSLSHPTSIYQPQLTDRRPFTNWQFDRHWLRSPVFFPFRRNHPGASLQYAYVHFVIAIRPLCVSSGFPVDTSASAISFCVDMIPVFK